MNLENVCIIGLKVLLAIGTGIAVFAGVEQAINNSKKQNNLENNNNNNNFTNNGFEHEVDENGLVVVKENNKFLDGLRATQDTCGKILTVIGALSTAVESISSIFGTRDYNINPPFYNPQTGYWVPPVNSTGKPGLYRQTRYIQVCV